MSPDGSPISVGVYVDAHLGIGGQARMLEDAGFTHLWVYDSPLVFGEPYMAMLVAALATEKIKIGPGVTQPLARPPYATAQAMATLEVAAPGRTVLGMGIGNSARWSIGMKPATLTRMHEDIDLIQKMLAGEEGTLREGDREKPIRFVHPDGRWINLAHHVPMWISAFGPRGQRMAGRNADGVLVRWEGKEALDQVRANLAEGAEAVGRDPAEIEIGVVFSVYPIESEDELREQEAFDALGPLVISRLRYLTANHSDASEVPEPFREGFDAYMQYREALDEETRHVENYEGYLVSVPDHLRDFVHPDSMRTVSHIGSADSVVSELSRMRDAGIDHVSLQIAGPPPRWCERMARNVLPKL